MIIFCFFNCSSDEKECDIINSYYENYKSDIDSLEYLYSNLEHLSLNFNVDHNQIDTLFEQ